MAGHVLHRTVSDAPWANDLNPWLDTLAGRTGGRLILRGDDGDEIDPHNADVLSSDNYTLYLASAAGKHLHIKNDDESADILRVADTGINIDVPVSIVGNTDIDGDLSVHENIMFDSGTAFTVTFDHAATADRVITVPDHAGEMAVPIIGTWTPTLGGSATYSAQIGHYVKIGPLVFLFCRMAVTTIGTGSVNTISGLPFASAMRSAGYVSAVSVAAANFVFASADIANGATTIQMNGLTAAGASTAALTFFGNSTAVTITAVYRTAA